MEEVVRADFLQLLNSTKAKVDFHISFEEKAVVIKHLGKKERFFYKKIKQTGQGGKLSFQSDGLKLTFSAASRDAEMCLSTAVANGRYCPNTANSLSSTTSASQSIAPSARSVTSVTSKISKDPLVRPSKVSSKTSTTSSIKSTCKSNVGLSLSSTNSTKSQDMPTKVSTSSISVVHTGPAKRKEDSGSKLTLVSRMPQTYDWYDQLDEADPSSRSLTDSPDTFFPTTSSSHVASPIPTKMRKYGTDKTASVVPVSRALFPPSASKALTHMIDDSTPHNMLFGDSTGGTKNRAVITSPTRIRAGDATLTNASAASPAATGAQTMTPPRRVQELSSWHTGKISSNNTGKFVSALSHLKASVAPVESISKQFNDPFQVQDDEDINGKKDSTTMNAKDSAPQQTNRSYQGGYFYKYAHKPHYYGTHFSSGSSGLHSEISSLPPPRRRFSGGVRNLGNTCYIGATVQALFTQKDLCDTLGGIFWPSLVMLQSKQLEEALITATSPTRLPSLSSPCVEQQQSKGQEGVSVENPLNQYKVHSVLEEFIKLLRTRADMTKTPHPSVASITTTVAGQPAMVLDVTRLKRSVSFHTKKYIGYCQQDAHEFLSDLLRLLEEETTERLMAFCASWQARQAQLQAQGQRGEGETGRVVLEGDGDMSSKKIHTPNTQRSVDDFNSLKRHFNDDSACLKATVKKQKTISSNNEDNNDEDDNRVSVSDAGDAESPALVSLRTTSLLPVAGAFESTVGVDMRCLRCSYKHATKLEPYQHFSLDLDQALLPQAPAADKHHQQQQQQQQYVTSTSSGTFDLRSLLGGFFSSETRELSCEHCDDDGGRSAAVGSESGSEGMKSSSPGSVACSLSACKSTAAHSKPGLALASLSLMSPPSSLVLHLKRFRYDASTHMMVKVHADVQFPLELNITTHLSHANTSNSITKQGCGSSLSALWQSSAYSILEGSCNPSALLLSTTTSTACTTSTSPTSGSGCRYVLSAVVRHLGTSESAGHYICDVRHSYEADATESATVIGSVEAAGKQKEKAIGLWRRCDDSNIYAVDEETVLGEKNDPYLLFYTAVT